MIPIYLGTVALDANRWGSRTPSIRISDWAPRFAADGFDGIELWEFHYLRAAAGEQEKLRDLRLPLVYNTYVGFADDDAESRRLSVRAIKDLAAPAVKYNIGNDSAKLTEYRRNLLAWCDTLPSNCQLLCECHPGTLLETPEAALAFHADLDSERFGIIVHPLRAPGEAETWLDAFGDRVQELHLQMRSPEDDPATAAGRQALTACAEVLKSRDFAGTVVLEFTRGIGRNEDVEEIYANALVDLHSCKEVLI